MKKNIFWSSIALAGILLIYFVLIPSFRGDLAINPVIQIGSISFRWYGVILAAAILASYFIVRKNSWKFGISKPDVDDFSFWLVLIGILGARVYFVFFSWDYFILHPNEIYKIWHGGLSIYGAIISCLIFGYFYSRKKAYTFWQMFDLVALSLPVGQAIGRFGNFINQEAYGTPTQLPWRMHLNGDYVHPAFLYEALASLLIFCALYRMLGKVKSGVIVFTYLMLYSLARFFIEGIRQDSFYILGFRTDQLIAALLVAVGFWGIFLRLKEKQTN